MGPKPSAVLTEQNCRGPSALVDVLADAVAVEVHPGGRCRRQPSRTPSLSQTSASSRSSMRSTEPTSEAFGARASFAVVVDTVEDSPGRCRRRDRSVTSQMPSPSLSGPSSPTFGSVVRPRQGRSAGARADRAVVAAVAESSVLAERSDSSGSAVVAVFRTPSLSSSASQSSAVQVAVRVRTRNGRSRVVIDVCRRSRRCRCPGRRRNRRSRRRRCRGRRCSVSLSAQRDRSRHVPGPTAVVAGVVVGVARTQLGSSRSAIVRIVEDAVVVVVGITVVRRRRRRRCPTLGHESGCGSTPSSAAVVVIVEGH